MHSAGKWGIHCSGAALFSVPFFCRPIKPQSLFLEYKSHISFLAPSSPLSSTPTYRAALPNRMAHRYIKGYMSTRDPIIFNLPANQITYLFKNFNIFYSILLYLNEWHHHSLSYLNKKKAGSVNSTLCVTHHTHPTCQQVLPLPPRRQTSNMSTSL